MILQASSQSSIYRIKLLASDKRIKTCQGCRGQLRGQEESENELVLYRYESHTWFKKGQPIESKRNYYYHFEKKCVAMGNPQVEFPLKVSSDKGVPTESREMRTAHPCVIQ